MKTIITTLIACVCLVLGTLATPINDQYYLKIKMQDQKEISYPPGTGFIAQDSKGNTVLNPSKLQELGSYEITEPITLWVFVDWNETPDTFELEEGKLILGISDRTYPNEHYGRPTDRPDLRVTRKKQKYGGWKGNSNGVTLVRARYFDFDEETGYDTSLEFSNDVVFYYRDGKASAWGNGKDLKIEGNYLIAAEDGIIKLSYNPQTKKVWWVFEKAK